MKNSNGAKYLEFALQANCSYHHPPFRSKAGLLIFEFSPKHGR